MASTQVTTEQNRPERERYLTLVGRLQPAPRLVKLCVALQL
jgi:hypothetical protein